MKIALAFSGGGYRASAFNLGAITYLDKVQIDGKSLLDCVIALSTVSGGTITGAKYAVEIKKGKTVQDIYTSLYRFFENTDLIQGSLARLESPDYWHDGRVKSLINAFADIYDGELFGGDKFGLLLDDENPIHLKHISFNATEFNTGLQFRFQITDKIFSPKSKGTYKGLIGNFENNIPEGVARGVRMADILASSSCFPGGFEPINFPHDFMLSASKDTDAFMEKQMSPLGLMDGGIVDNQGIEPLILAERRMQTSNPDCKECNFDLIIVSDVSSPYMESFTASEQNPEKGWRKLTLRKLRNIAWGVCILAFITLISCIYYNIIIPAVISAIVLTLSILVLIPYLFIGKMLKNVRILDITKLKDFMGIRLGVIEGLLQNRAKAVMKLVGGVFMKHIRRLNYRSVYEVDRWKNRRITNAIYELRAGEKRTEEKIKKDKLGKELIPSEDIQKVSAIASNMETTLWFEQRHRDNRTLDSLIACGQYGICWNLIAYIEELKQDNSNTNESHQLLMTCEKQLREDWDKFQKNPYWLVDIYNSRMTSVK